MEGETEVGRRALSKQSVVGSGAGNVVWIAVLGLLSASWCVMMLGASSRDYFLVFYGVGEVVDPFFEPFATSDVAMLGCLLLAASWFGLHWRRAGAVIDGPFEEGQRTASVKLSVVFMVVSLLPLVIWVLRGAGMVTWRAQIWEVLWMAGWSGVSFGVVVRDEQVEKRGSWLWWVLVAVAVMCAGWWYGQSMEYHRNFMLGFNDFGHFLQRVANTAEGRGVLLESPVLPMFWDHFNPGLLLLVPLWMIYPNVDLVFVIQAGALASGSLFIYLIARQLGLAQATAAVFGAAWLMQPAVGQMNLAYTYGWHPITLAIPFLLAAIWCLLAKRRLAALVCTLLALSMEEGVFVVVALVAAACAVLPFMERWITSLKRDERQSEEAGGDRDEHVRDHFVRSLPTVAWIAVAVVAVLGFVLVYRFSGLADFQTGRFVALGKSPTEILMSPVFRPTAFWGRVLDPGNLVFVGLLWLPCGLPAFVRGWRYVLPTLLPLAVLIVWDHHPAHSLAFHYPSTLQPLFWLACLSGAAKVTPQKVIKLSVGTKRGEYQHDAVAASRVAGGMSSAVTALVTGTVLSFFVGQLPFSSRSLQDVEGTTYGAESEWRRRSDRLDGEWLLQRLAEIRKTGSECLATGRIAAHLVGNRDVETVGQYLERRDRLAELADRKGKPIRHYEFIVLDRLEGFQQSSAQVQAVEREVRASGFEVVAEEFEVVVFRRR